MWLFVPAASALAQPSSATDVPDRFVIEAGGFNMFVSTHLTLDAPPVAGTDINFENGLDLPGSVQRGYLEGFWRIARRHQVSLDYTRLSRTGDGIDLQRDLTWGGVTYHAGLSVAGHTKSDWVSGVYRLAAYKNPRFEFGPAVGFGYLWLTAGISGSAGVTAPQGNPTGSTLDREVTENTPTGDVGGFANWWVAPRVYVRGDLRYIVIKPSNSEAAVTQSRASVAWYPWRHLGFGGQYTYDKLRYDRNILSSQVGGFIRYQGVQVFASAAF